MSNPIIIDPGFDPEPQTVVNALIPKKTSWTDYWVSGATILDNGVGLYVPVILDNFLRPDTAAGILGTALRGGSWYEDPLVSAHISSHKVVSTATGQSFSCMRALDRPSNLIEVNFAWAATSGGAVDTKIELDFQENGDPDLVGGIRLLISHGTAKVQWVDTNGGDPIAHDIASLSFTPAADAAANKVQFFVNGNVASMFVNGTEATNSPVTDALIATHMPLVNQPNWSIITDADLARAASITTVGAFVQG